MPGIRTILARWKRKLLKKEFLKDKKHPPFWFAKLLGGQPASIVQIGSNDGRTGDPLYQLLHKNKTWSALFVEPIPEIFEKLKGNYANEDRFQFENVAINEGTKMTFYSVDSRAKEKYPDLPFWYDQLGSFDKAHILKNFDGKLEPFIISTALEGISLTNLFNRNKIKQIDILHIDTEGYDWKILSQLDLERYKPTFILYEHNHLNVADKQAAIHFLKKDFFLFEAGIDTLAVNRKSGNHLQSEMSKYMKPLL